MIIINSEIKISLCFTTRRNDRRMKKEKEHSKAKWFIEIFVTTFILSMAFSYISNNGVNNLNMVASVIILIVVILIGILFDIIGVAVTVAKEHEFHAKATKKAVGAKSN